MIFRDRDALKRAKNDSAFLEQLLSSEDATKFIKYVIKTYTKNPAFFMQQNKVEWEDLYQSCLIGLYNGIWNLNLDLTPNEWVRYLYVTIQGEIKNFTRSNQSNSLGISQKIRLLYPKYIAFYNEFREMHKMDPSIQDTMKVFSISRNEAFDLIYGMQHVISYFTETGETNQELTLNSSEGLEKAVVDRVLVQQYMLLLNNKEKKVLYMYYYLGFSKTEIAREVGCGNTMVQKHIMNAFKKIKRFDMQMASSY